jgi:predicted permease
MNDFRYAARVLAKAPVFTIVAAGLLAAGIGANVVIFSVVDAVLLRPLEVRHPQDLVRIVQKTPQLGTRSSFLYLFYEALRDHSTTLSTVFGEEEFRVALNEPRPAQQIQVMAVTPEFFAALGVPALYGRTLTVEDGAENPGMIPAVLSHGFWSRRFNRDPRAIGQTITLHRHKFVIAGVMPRDFNGTLIDVSPDVRVPLRAAPLLIDWGGHPPAVAELVNLSLAGRLKPGVTRAQARAECLALWRAATERFFQDRAGQYAGALEDELRRGLDIDPLDRGTSILRDRFGGALRLLAASVVLLLMMVCANIAGLPLARSVGRGEEIAVRMALGATHAGLARPFLAEACVIAAVGSAGGILIALPATRLLVGALPPVRDLYTARMALSAAIGVNWPVLLFFFGAFAATVLLFGLAPAIAASHVNLDGALRGARASSRSPGRRGLIVFQIALCTVLLSGAALLARSWQRLRTVESGFDRDHIVTFTADPSLAGYTPPQVRSLRLALMERVRELPGVTGAAVASRPLMRGSGVKTTVAPEGQRPTAADFLNTSLNAVTPGSLWHRAVGSVVVRAGGIAAGRGRGHCDRDSGPPGDADGTSRGSAARPVASRPVLALRNHTHAAGLQHGCRHGFRHDSGLLLLVASARTGGRAGAYGPGLCSARGPGLWGRGGIGFLASTTFSSSRSLDRLDRF